METVRQMDTNPKAQKQAMSRTTCPTLAPPGSATPPSGGVKTKAKRAAQRVSCKSLRLTVEESADIAVAARACGMTPSGFLRACALGQRVEAKPLAPAVNAQTYGALGKVGVNLNQIAVRLNATGKADAQQIAAAVTQLAGVIKTLRRELLGGTS